MKSTASQIRVLMCCSSLDVKGGMVSVVKNYLSYPDWDEFNIDFVPTHVPGNKVRVAAHFALTLPKIRHMLRKHEVDLVHLHVAERGSFWRKAMIAEEAKKSGIPVVFHHHAAEFEPFFSGLGPDAQEKVEKVCNDVDVNLVLSDSIKRSMEQHFPNARFKVLYNAVPTYGRNLYNPDAYTIVFMGRLGERKGTFDLIKAFSTVASRIDSKYHVALCGDGDIEAARSQIDELGLSDRIACLGWVDSEQRERILNDAVLNVLPSYNEGLPMSILEAMAHGIPTVSTNIAAIPEVVQSGVNGVLIEPGDIDALGDALTSLLDDADDRKQMSEAAFDLIESTYSLDAHMKQVKELYQSLC